MKAALVRLVLVAPLLFSGSIYALNDVESELFMTSAVRSQQQGATTNLCRAIRICHNSKAFAYTSVQVFSALEGLLTQLQLSPANDYVQLTQLTGCVGEQCCCSTPTQIQLSLPVWGKDAEAEADRLLQLMSRYLEQQLPHTIDGLVCMGHMEVCAAEAGGSSSSRSGGRQLLSGPELSVGLLSVQPVPELPAGGQPVGSTAVLELADYYAGSYGEDSSSGYGAYGSYAAQQAAATAASAAAVDGESAGAAGRSLLALPEKQQAAMKATPAAAANAAPKQVRSKGSAVGNGTRSADAATCVPCPTCSNTPGSSKGQQQQLNDGSSSGKAGSCYCRYVARSASWALEESACKAALYARCGPAGSLLECKHLEAYYSALAKSRLAPMDAPHVDAISAFLYVDCPPAPPCSCKALTLSAKETKAQREQCCADLKAWCQVPFSGIDCNEAVSFCSSSSSLAEDTVYGFALVKTHGADCKDLHFGAAYTSTVVEVPAAFEEVEAMFLEQQRLAVQQRRMAAGATIAATLVASCVAVGVAAFAVLAIVKHHAIRRVTAPMDANWRVY